MMCENCGYPVTEYRSVYPVILTFCPRCGHTLPDPVKIEGSKEAPVKKRIPLVEESS